MTTFQHFIAWFLVGFMAIVIPILGTSAIFVFIISPLWVLFMALTSRRQTVTKIVTYKQIEGDDDYSEEWNLN